MKTYWFVSYSVFTADRTVGFYTVLLDITPAQYMAALDTKIFIYSVVPVSADEYTALKEKGY